MSLDSVAVHLSIHIFSFVPITIYNFENTVPMAYCVFILTFITRFSVRTLCDTLPMRHAVPEWAIVFATI
jgi:hypothetical protein